MKNIKNKYIEARKNSPSKGGFSDLRIRFFVLTCMVIILVLAPFLGFLYSSMVVILFAYFLAVKRSEFEHSNYECMYNHMKERDRLYGGGVDIEYCKRLVRSYQFMNGKRVTVSQPVAKHEKAKVSKQATHSGNLKLALNR